MKSKQLLGAAVAAFGLFASAAQAGLIGYLSSNGGAGLQTAMEAAIALNGDTAQQIGDLANDDLSGFDAIWLVEDDNNGAWAEYLAGAANVNSYVSGGGRLVFNDRSVGENPDTASYLTTLGAGALVQTGDNWSDTTFSAPGGTLLTNGPNGVLDDTSLDLGTSSYHGGLTRASVLALTGVPLVERASDGDVISAFSFTLGAGAVFYDRSPMAYYLTGSGNAAAREAFTEVYAPNALVYVQALNGGNPQPPAQVPVPFTPALLMVGLLGLAIYRRVRMMP